MIIFLYVIAIVGANLLSANIEPIKIGPFLISPGTFTIAATFVLRDFIQNSLGRFKTYIIIALALGMSALTGIVINDPMTIVFASAVAFGISETTDTEIYTRLKLPMAYRVMWSGIASGILDSVAFVIIGLSPIGMDFIPWPAIPAAIAGQAITKAILQSVGVIMLKFKPNYSTMPKNEVN